MQESQLSPPSQVIKRALLSVSDKTEIVPLAQSLRESEVEIISTGGTAEILRKAKIPLREVSDVTEFPELMNGRLKTLHPRIHGGLLAQRDNPDHCEAMFEHGIENIDLLVVNLYPFEETLKRTDDEAELIENTDIGGPAMIRAAAKNHAHVCVLTSPEEYRYLLDEMQRYDGGTRDVFRRYLAALAFHRTSRYDAVISEWMKGTVRSCAEAELVGQKDLFSDLYRSRYSLVFDSNFRVNLHEDAIARENEWRKAVRLCTGAIPTDQKNLSDSFYISFKANNLQECTIEYTNTEKNAWVYRPSPSWFDLIKATESGFSCILDSISEIDDTKEILFEGVAAEKNR